MKKLIIIPAYNEEKNIASVIAGIKKATDGADILIVNDGSKDNTKKAARDAGAIVVSHPFNLGYGGALQTGYRYAARNNYDLLVQMDADGQHDPSCINELLDPVLRKEADVAIGSRFLREGHVAGTSCYDAPFARRLGMKLFNAIASFLTGQEITDSTSGYQAMNRKVFQFFAGDKFPIDYPDADVIIMLHRAGFSFREVPVRMYPSPGNKSMHSGFKPFYYVFKMFLSIIVTLMRRI